MQNKKRKVKSLFIIALLFFISAPSAVLAQYTYTPYGSCLYFPLIDADKDGVGWGFLWKGEDLTPGVGCGSGAVYDCNDNDPYSHVLGSRNITSATFTKFDGGKISSDPPSPLLSGSESPKGYLPLENQSKITITLGSLPCGLATPYPSYLTNIKVFYGTKNALGQEVVVELPAIAFSLVGGATYTTNIKYSMEALLESVNYFSQVVEQAILSVSAGRPVFLKFVGVTIGSRADTPFYYNIPKMSNCARVSGSGKYKLIYMRGQSSGFTANDLLNQAKRDVSGFNTIEPIKSNNSQLSHFVDFKNHNDDWPIVSGVVASLCKKSNVSTTKYFKDDRPDVPKAISSCGSLASFYYFHQAKLPGAYAEVGNLPGTLYISTQINPKTQTAAVLTPEVAVHEFAHAFGHLDDEYLYCDPKDLARDPFPIAYHNNCSTDPLNDWAQSLKLSPFGVYAYTYPGCEFKQSYSGRYTYRPSSNSIMNYNYSGRPFYNMFNAVSCAWLQKKFKGGLARDYFSTCAAMPGIIPVGK